MKIVCALLLFAVVSTAFAEEGRVTIEPPAPVSYSEDSPDYIFFKKIVITRKSKSTCDIDITLQGEIPVNTGSQYLVYFDFSDLSVKRPKLVRGDFSSDMWINIFRGPLDSEFEVIVHGIEEVTGRTLTLDVGPVRPRGNEINFSVRSPIFAKDMPTKVIFKSGKVGQSKKTLVVNGEGGGQETPPVDLPH